MNTSTSPSPCVLILHPETEYFAGAEKMLQYFLKGLAQTELSIQVALVRGSKVDQGIPNSIRRIDLPPMPRLSLPGLFRQLRAVWRDPREKPVDLIHAWAARSWELASLLSKLMRRPAIGTLHDHPQAPFISRQRQVLMRQCARWGLQYVVAVSEAVRQAACQAGYPPRKLTVVRNGLSDLPSRPAKELGAVVHLGYLGVLSERKGLRGLFAILEGLANQRTAQWDFSIAGEAQDEIGRQLVVELRQRYLSAAWWPRVRWLGWINDPAKFLAELDCLLLPSPDFDPFPTVILEAGFAGVPVLGSCVGGVPEIISPGQTGWLFEPGDWLGAAKILAGLLTNAPALAPAGQAAQRHVRGQFSVDKMVANYRDLYFTIWRQ